jgi:hypothetical protein
MLIEKEVRKRYSAAILKCMALKEWDDVSAPIIEGVEHCWRPSHF